MNRKIRIIQIIMGGIGAAIFFAYVFLSEIWS